MAGGRPFGYRELKVDYNPKHVSITLDQYEAIKNKYGNTHYICECGAHEPCGRTKFLDFLRDLVRESDRNELRGKCR